MTLRPAADYLVDRDTIAAASAQLKLPLQTVRALVSFFTRDLPYPDGNTYVEMSTQLLTAAGIALTEAQRENATGAELFAAFYALNREAATNAGRFSPFHILGSLRANCGLATPATFKAALVDGNVTRAFTAFVRLLRDTGLVVDLQNKQWSTFATKYATLNALPDIGWPTNWSSNFASHMTYQA